MFFSALWRFDLDSWGSDENDNITGTFWFCQNLHKQPSLSALQTNEDKDDSLWSPFIFWFCCQSTITQSSFAFLFYSLFTGMALCVVFIGEHTEFSLGDSWPSLHSHLFPPDLVNLPAVSSHQPNPSVPRYCLIALTCTVALLCWIDNHVMCNLLRPWCDY